MRNQKIAFATAFSGGNKCTGVSALKYVFKNKILDDMFKEVAKF